MASNLDRTADALLQQKALQTTHHERLTADTQQASRALRLTFQQTRDANAEVKRLSEDLRDVHEEAMQLERAFEVQHQLRLSMLTALRAKGVEDADAMSLKLESAGLQWVGAPSRLVKVNALFDEYETAVGRARECFDAATEARLVAGSAQSLHNAELVANSLRMLQEELIPAVLPQSAASIPASQTDKPNSFISIMCHWEQTTAAECATLTENNSAMKARTAVFLEQAVSHTKTTSILQDEIIAARTEELSMQRDVENHVSMRCECEAALATQQNEAIPALRDAIITHNTVALPMLEAFCADAVAIARDAAKSILPADASSRFRDHARKRSEHARQREMLRIKEEEVDAIQKSTDELFKKVAHGANLFSAAEHDWTATSTECHALLQQKKSLEMDVATERAAIQDLLQQVEVAQQRRMERVMAVQAAITYLVMEEMPGVRSVTTKEEESAFQLLAELQLSDLSSAIECAAHRQQQEQLKQQQQLKQKQKETLDEQRRLVYQAAESQRQSNFDGAVDGAGRPTTAHVVPMPSAGRRSPPPPATTQKPVGGVVLKKFVASTRRPAGLRGDVRADKGQTQQAAGGKMLPKREPSLAFSAWSADAPEAIARPPSPPPSQLRVINVNSGNGGAKMSGLSGVRPQDARLVPRHSQNPQHPASAAAPMETPSPLPRQPAAGRRRAVPADPTASQQISSRQQQHMTHRGHATGSSQLATAQTSLAAALRRPPWPSSQQHTVRATPGSSSGGKKEDDEFDVFAL